MNVAELYSELGKKSNDILTTSLENKDLSLLASNHCFICDLADWLEILNDRPEKEILKNAVKELQIAVLCNNLGLYQQAFMGLRFFLERMLVSVYFSANEIELNLWKIGERDTYWNEIIDNDKDKDKEKGIFSNKFCKAFFPELKNEISHFKAITIKVYRECSEFVHGNQSVINKIPNTLSYSEELFQEWNLKVDTIKRVILFTLCLRYLKQLKPEQVKKIENSLIEEFKSIIPIIEIINR